MTRQMVSFTNLQTPKCTVHFPHCTELHYSINCAQEKSGQKTVQKCAASHNKMIITSYTRHIMI